MKKIQIVLLLFLFLLFYGLLSSAIAQEKKWGLKEAVAFALKNNPDSTISQKKIEAAEALVQQSQSGLFPQIHLSSSYTQTNNPMYSFGNILNQAQFNETIDFNNPGRTDNLQLKAEVRYRIFSGGSIGANIKMTQSQLQSSRLHLTAVQNQLAFEVVRLFHLINKAKEGTTAKKAALDSITASYQVAKARFNAGDLLKRDLLNLQLQKSKAEADLLKASHELALTKKGFSNLLGLTDSNYSIDLTNIDKQQIPPKVSYSARPEIKQVDAVVGAAKAKLDKARGAKLPVIDSFASYQVNAGTILDGEEDSWMAGIRLDYLLFDGNKASASILSAQANLAEVKEEKKKIILQIDLEVESAKLTLKQAEEELLVTVKMVDLATESARLSRVRFKEGVLLASELIDVERQLTDARVHRSAAHARQKIAVADLRRVAGLPQFEPDL